MKPAPRLPLTIVIIAGVVLFWHLFAGWRTADAVVLLGSDHVDMWGTHWFYWMFEERLFRGEPFAHTDLLFYPWGKDVYLHTGGNVLDALLALPFRWALGDTLGYNVFVVAILASNGISGGWLVRKMGANSTTSVVVGILAALQPYVLAELAEGRLTQSILVFPTLFLAEWLRMFTNTNRARMVRAALWLALTGLVYWYYALFCGVLAVAVLIVRAIETRRREERFDWVFPIGTLGLSLVLVLPLAWPMIRALGEGTVPGLLAVETWNFTHWSPMTRDGFTMGIGAFDPLGLESGLYYPMEGGIRFLSPTRTVMFTTVVLMGFGLLRTPGPWRWTLIVGIVLMVLIASGPTFGGERSNPIYVLFARVFPPMQRLWWPDRALGILSVWLLLPIAWGLSSLEKPRKTVFLGLTGLMGFGWEISRFGLSPLPVTPLEIPEVVTCLAGGEGAILELPYGSNPESLLHQTVHGRARFGGMLESNPTFVPSEHAEFLREDPVMVALMAVMDGERLCADGVSEAIHCTPRPTTDDIRALGDLGLALVVVERSALGANSGAGGQVSARSRALHDLSELLGPGVPVGSDTVVYQPWDDVFECESRGNTDGVP